MKFFNSVFEHLVVSEVQYKPVLDILLLALKRNPKVFIIGNGGSGLNGIHLAQDLVKVGNIDARCLSENVGLVTAIANDVSYEDVFCKQLSVFAKKGDLLIAISGSGNSPNIVKAVTYARFDLNMLTFSFTGNIGGEVKKITKHNVNVNSNNMFVIESIHSVLFHYLIEELNAK